MALPINSFTNYVFNMLYISTIQTALESSADVQSPATKQSTPIPTPELTAKLLQSFSFPILEVEKAFNLADGLQAYTGQGNNQLTRQEIRFYIEHSQSSAQTAEQVKPNLLILLLLEYYFEQLADIDILTPYGHYQAISLQQLKALAVADGDNSFLTLQDIELYLQKKAEFTQSIAYSDMLKQQPGLIDNAGQRQQFFPLRSPESKLDKHYHPMVEAVQPADYIDIKQKIDLPESDELAIRLQVFSFNVSEILHLTRIEKRPISILDLEKSLKIAAAYQLDLERIMQSIRPGQKSSVCFSKALLIKQLEQARRSTALLRVLRQHFDEIAEMDGDSTGISKDDIELLAGLDGNAENLTLEDLKRHWQEKNKT